ncbi:MAG TPA: hypothetical protein PKK26_12530 [Candidatus Wallbacteria bacterium]|nr:hypothetical protein [Candidatus Wallbacteria bacterium]
MFRSRTTIIILIIIALSIYMQFGNVIKETFSSFVSAPTPDPAKVADAYIPGTVQPGQSADPKMVGFEENDYQKLLYDIKSLKIENFDKVKLPKEYTFQAKNIFVPRITSSREMELGETGDELKKTYAVILNPADLTYVGFYNTPGSMTALFKTRASDSRLTVVKTGDFFPNSNLRLKAANERYVIFENLIDQSTSRIYFTAGANANAQLPTQGAQGEKK